jgi:hypothetical protein
MDILIILLEFYKNCLRAVQYTTLEFTKAVVSPFRLSYLSCLKPTYVPPVTYFTLAWTAEINVN